VGLFATKESIDIFYNRNTSHAGLFVGGGGLQLAVQFIAGLIIAVWAFFWSYLLFLVIKKN